MKRIQKQAIMHYDRMIKWAEKQPQDEPVKFLKMERYIGESWGDDDCPYCEKYFHDDSVICPLSNNSLTCDGDICCNGIFGELSDATTWNTWLEYAKQVREYIRENG